MRVFFFYWILGKKKYFDKFKKLKKLCYAGQVLSRIENNYMSLQDVKSVFKSIDQYFPSVSIRWRWSLPIKGNVFSQPTLVT
jgi:hypothetical protein